MHILHSIFLGALGGCTGSSLANFVRYRLVYRRSGDRADLVASMFTGMMAAIFALLTVIYVCLSYSIGKGHP